MKDKEKQIEEMAKDKQWQRRDNYCLRIQKALQYKGTADNEDVPSILVDFENEIRKEMLPKDSVAITKEEYSNYLITQTNNEFLKEQAEKLKADNKRLYKNIGKFKELTVKETVDKIYNYAEKFLFEDPTDNIYFKEYVKEEFGFDIKE